MFGQGGPQKPIERVDRECGIDGRSEAKLARRFGGDRTVVGGTIEKGPFGFWVGLVPHGVPWWLWPLVLPLEIFGLVTKPFALMVRLFANMTAGHVILGVLAGFLAFGNIGFGAYLGSIAMVGVPTVAFYLFILVFELAVAFIQAYIFAYLSSIFIGLMLSHEH